MSQPEFIQNNDKTIWIDASTTEENVRKGTVIPISHHYDYFEEFLQRLPVKFEGRIRSLAVKMVQEVLRVGCNARRAWVHGDDVAYESHVNQIAPIVINMLEGSIEVSRTEQEQIIGHVRRKKGRHAKNFNHVTIRDMVWHELNMPENDKLRQRLYDMVGCLLDDLYVNMSPNHYVMHEVNFDLTPRCAAVYQLDDWRAIQWTKDQLEKKRIENNDN